MSESVATPAPPFLADLTARIDRAVIDRLDRCELPADLRDAIAYALAPGGKRLRPALAMLSAEAAGGAADDALDAAVAIEYIHNFSLIHDDLPAIDNDVLRRGRPTLHVQFGEAMAILAGDALVSMAMAIAATTTAPADSTAIVAELARATTAMIGGQVEDVAGSGDGRTEGSDAERLEQIHRGKTGALIRASCRIGGHCAHADNAALDRLTEYGEHIGLMFQIVDDLLDVTQPASHTGKATGKDVNAGKMTYPGVHGVDASRQMVTELHDRACDALASFGTQAENLRMLARHLADRTR